MVPNWLRPTPRHGPRRRNLARGPRPTFRPRLEALEDRTLPATFFVTNLLDSGAGSLRQAVLNAESSSGPDQIDFSVTGTITLTGGQLNVSESLTINGPGASNLTISGGDATRLFFVTGGAFQVNNLTLADGRAAESNGGAVFSQGFSDLTFDTVRFLNNSADGNGGAIDTPGNPVTVSNSVFLGNTAFNGGAISVGGAPVVTITNSVFEDNSANNTGGALNSNTSATFNVTDTAFTNNTARYGGAIATVSTLNVTRVVFGGNLASGADFLGDARGGAIWSENTSTPFTTTITDSTFTSNSARGADGTVVEILDGFDGLGGAIFSDGFSSLTVSGSTFSGNAAVAGDGVVSGSLFGTAGNARGGAIYFDGFLSSQALNVSRSTFSGNLAVAGTDAAAGLVDAEGGAIAHRGAGIATITSATLADNRVNTDTFAGTVNTQGGGISCAGSNPVRVRNSILSGNVVETRNGFGGLGPDAFGAFTSLGFNLVSNTANSTGFGATGDLLGVAAALGPLQDNGGPTATRLPLSGSAVLGAGDPSLAGTLDQRGVVRGTNVEIGAVDVTVNATQLTLSAPASATAGAGFTVTLTARDASGNVAIDYAGTVRFTDDVGVREFTFSPSDRGVQSFFVVFTQAGLRTFTVTDINNPSLSASVNVTVNPAQAAFLEVTPLPDLLTAGIPVGFTVTARDAFGNVATGYTGTVTFTSSDPQATLPAPYTFTPQDAGSRAFSATFRTAGPQTLTLEDASSELQTTVEANVQPGRVATFAVTPLPADVNAGTPFSFTVSPRDAFGNVVTGYTGTVIFASTDPQATLPANFTFSAQDEGSRTFSATLRTAGPQTLTVRDASNALVRASVGTNVRPGVAAAFTLVPLPANVPAGTPAGFTVIARDAFGNVATGYTGTVTFASTDPQATLPANFTFTAADAGSRAFSVTFRTAGPQSLTARDAGNPSLTATTDTTVGSAQAVAFALEVPPGVNQGEPFTVTVRALDAFGNVATNFAGSASVSSSDLFANLPAQLTFALADGGVLTFSVVLRTAGPATLTLTGLEDPTLQGTAGVVVFNVAPSAVALQLDRTAVLEGEFVVLTGSFADPGTGEAHTLLVLWGDGTSDAVTLLPGVSTFTLSHRFADDRSPASPDPLKALTVAVTDAGGATATGTAQVLVENVAPAVTGIDEVRLTAGGAINVTLTATDPGADVLTALADFGDGTGVAGVEVGADGTIVLRHPYPAEGTFTVRVTVIDGDGGQAVETFFVQVLLPGIDLDEVEIGLADPGEQVTVSAGGVTATLFNNGDERAGILVASVPPPVADRLDGNFAVTSDGPEGEVITASFDVRAFNVSADDVAVVTFRYAGDGPPTLRFFDPAVGAYVPFVGAISVNEAEKTITIVLDGTSTPTLQGTRGTVFTISVPAPEPPEPPPPPPATIPVPLFAVGRGGSGEVALARLDTGVDFDGGTALDGAGIGAGSESRSAASGGTGVAEEEGSAEGPGEEGEEPLSDLPESEPVKAPPLSATVTPSQPDAPGSEPEVPAAEEAAPPTTEEGPEAPPEEALRTPEPPLPGDVEGAEPSALDALFSDIPEEDREGHAAPLLGAVAAGAWWAHTSRRRRKDEEV